jgi:hypothetical protein
VAKPAVELITWITLWAARRRVGQAFLSPRYAEKWIIKELEAGNRVRWRAKVMRLLPGVSADTFWKMKGFTHVNWRENTIGRLGLGGLIGVEVALEDLPTGPQPQPAAPKEKSKTQKLIIKFADEEFPNGWKDLPTPSIVKAVVKRFEKQELIVPSPATFKRALSRRPD